MHTTEQYGDGSHGPTGGDLDTVLEGAGADTSMSPPGWERIWLAGMLWLLPGRLLWGAWPKLAPAVAWLGTEGIPDIARALRPICTKQQ